MSKIVKFRATITTVCEVEVSLDCYPEGVSVDAITGIEMENLRNDQETTISAAKSATTTYQVEDVRII